MSDGGIILAIISMFGAYFFVIALISIVLLLLWIWALVDCIKKEFPGNEKNTWLAVLIVSFFLGVYWLAAIIYLIVGRPKGILPVEIKDNKEEKENHIADKDKK